MHSLQEHLIRKDGHVLTDPLPTYDATLIHEEERPSCKPTLEAAVIDLGACLPVEDSVRLGDLQVRITKQGVGQLELSDTAFWEKGC